MEPYGFGQPSSALPFLSCCGEGVLVFFMDVLLESPTNISARSSESSLTIVLTVEYKIGLKQPENPNRYQATNLVDH
jgi:hypothetical protein